MNGATQEGHVERVACRFVSREGIKWRGCLGMPVVSNVGNEVKRCAGSKDRTAAALVFAGLNLKGNAGGLCECFVDTAILHGGAL